MSVTARLSGAGGALVALTVGGTPQVVYRGQAVTFTDAAWSALDAGVKSMFVKASQDAGDIPFTPSGDIEADEVSGALAELDSDLTLHKEDLELHAAGQRIGGFIGNPSSQIQLTTVNEVQDIPAATVTFTKGPRPIRCVVSIDGVYNTLTTRWPLWVVRNSANAVQFSWTVPISVANSAMLSAVAFEPATQPAEGEHTWKLALQHSAGATPGTATVPITAKIQLLVYNA